MFSFTSTCRRIYQIRYIAKSGQKVRREEKIRMQMGKNSTNIVNSLISKRWEKMTREYLAPFHRVNEKTKTPTEWKIYLKKYLHFY